MRLASSTSRFSQLLVLVALAAWVGPAQAAGVCLPPAFDRGERLQEVGALRLAHLDLALRQHRVCASLRPGDGPRVFLIGNSAVLGHPLPWVQTFAARLSERFPPSQARIFNLGTLFSYQLKDALVLDAALPYEPDAVVWGLVLDDFSHFAPSVWPGMVEFFRANAPRVVELAARPPDGLAEPLALYARYFQASPPEPATWLLLRSAGAYLQLAVRHAARELLTRGLLEPADLPPPAIDPSLARALKRADKYRCAEVEARFARDLTGWQSWNVLAHLERLSKERGIPVLVVNLPVAHEPIGRCYNAHYPTARYREYLAWMNRETRRRGLAYADLHDLVPASEFLDSMHPSAAGHQRVAEALAPHIAELARVAATRTVQPRSGPATGLAPNPSRGGP